MSARRDSAGLTVASVVNGIAAYAIVVVAGRQLDPVGFADFSVAWSLWALSVALLVFPIQHWIIWRSAEDLGTEGVRAAMPRVLGLIAVVLAALFLAGTSDRLFPDGSGWGAILVVLGATSAGLGLSRGSLAAQSRYGDVAWIIGAENVLRLLAVFGVLLITDDARWPVSALAVGVLVLVPFAGHLRFRKGDPQSEVRVIAELGALAGAMALAQAMVQFPPAMAGWLGDSPERVSAIFATFSLGRAPLLVILAVSARLTQPLTRFMSRPSSQVSPLLWRAAGIGAFGVFTAGVLGYLVGPTIVGWFFGQDKTLNQTETAYIAAGLALATVGVVVTLALMAKRLNKLAAAYWLLALFVAVGLAWGGLDVPQSFFVAEVAAVGAGVVTLLLLVRSGQVSVGGR